MHLPPLIAPQEPEQQATEPVGQLKGICGHRMSQMAHQQQCPLGLTSFGVSALQMLIPIACGAAAAFLEPEHGVVGCTPELISEMGIAPWKPKPTDGPGKVLGHIHGNQTTTAAWKWTGSGSGRGLSS